jgi:hypothetical protein
MITVSLAIPPVRSFLRAAVEGLVAVNYVELQRFALPLLYDSGVTYQREPRGRERWQTATETLRLQRGDCEDLAAWRAAELRFYEGDPAIVEIIRTGPRQFHAVVMRGDGTIEDPSRRLR